MGAVWYFKIIAINGKTVSVIIWPTGAGSNIYPNDTSKKFFLMGFRDITDAKNFDPSLRDTEFNIETDIPLNQIQDDQ